MCNQWYSPSWPPQLGCKDPTEASGSVTWWPQTGLLMHFSFTVSHLHSIYSLSGWKPGGKIMCSLIQDSQLSYDMHISSLVPKIVSGGSGCSSSIAFLWICTFYQQPWETIALFCPKDLISRLPSHNPAFCRTGNCPIRVGTCPPLCTPSWLANLEPGDAADTPGRRKWPNAVWSGVCNS